MSTILVLRGIPASGKSSFAKTWVMESPESRIRVNRDDIREALFGAEYHSQAPDKKKEKRVSDFEDALLVKALRENKDVVVDNTHVNMRFLSKYERLADQFGATVTHRDFPIQLDEALRRNSQRERVVPESVIRRMYDNLGPDGQFPIYPGSYPVKDFVMPTQRKLAIGFDMDGTLVDTRSVQHYLDAIGRNGKPLRNFDSFHRMSEFSPANDEVMKMMQNAHDEGYAVLITTARSERYRETTQKWLDERGGLYENIFMRADGDSRSDNLVKKDMFHEIQKHYDLVRQVDDNPAAIDAWVSNGVAVSTVPFGRQLGDMTPLNLDNPFSDGRCVRCGRSFRGSGSLGPTCKMR